MKSFFGIRSKGTENSNFSPKGFTAFKNETHRPVTFKLLVGIFQYQSPYVLNSDSVLASCIMIQLYSTECGSSVFQCGKLLTGGFLNNSIVKNNS